MNRFFDSIEAVFVINLDRRPDRWATFKQRWQGLIPEEKLIRISAVDGQLLEGYGEYPWFTEDTKDASRIWWGGMAGRVLSHKKAIYEAMKRGFLIVAIMEDDAMPSVTMSKFKYDRVFSKFLNREAKWGVLYLGFGAIPLTGVPLIRESKDQVDIWRVGNVSASHAYLIHRDSFTSVLSNLPEKAWVWDWIARYRSIDRWFRQYFERESKLPVYAALPRLMIQGPCTSDIDPSRKNVHVQTINYRKPVAVVGAIYIFFRFLLRPFYLVKRKLASFFSFKRSRKKGFTNRIGY